MPCDVPAPRVPVQSAARFAITLWNLLMPSGRNQVCYRGQETVLEKKGVDLIPEKRIVGEAA